MKTKTIIMGLMVVCLALSNGCKKPEKGETGPAGPQGQTGANGADGPEATTQNYTLTFTTAQNWQTYNGFAGLFDANDIIVTYIFNATYGEDFYVQLPFTYGTVVAYAEVGETTGYIFINTDKANGTTGSPWSSNTTLKFKSVLIKSKAMKKHPNLNLKDYNAVKQAFNLAD